MENKPEKCATCKRSSKADGYVVCANCIHNNSRKDRYEPLTNGDRIRNMTDDEMAKIINRGCPPGGTECSGSNGRCGLCWLDWLRSPVEESEK